MPLLTVDEAEVALAQSMGRPLVFLHGVGSDRLTWRPQVDAFASYYPTVAVDFGGHRESRASAETVSLARFVADVAALIDALGAGPAHLSNEENPDAFNAELCRFLGTTVEASNG
jgi:pimeloyl-ACP methyl ester carboxylesterase